MTPKKPNFSKYYEGDWDYNWSAGVGLKFTGYPSDIEKFIELLQDQSCNPVASRRILDELASSGVKYTTLMPQLDFNFIGDNLKSLGVHMEIVPPINRNRLNNSSIDSGVFSLLIEKETDLSQYSEHERGEIKNRMNQFLKSIHSHSQNFGPYEDDNEIRESAMRRIRANKY